jgi:hypothetical protein
MEQGCEWSGTIVAIAAQATSEALEQFHPFVLKDGFYTSLTPHRDHIFRA